MSSAGANPAELAAKISRVTTFAGLCIFDGDIAVQHLRIAPNWLNYMQRFVSAYFVCTCRQSEFALKASQIIGVDGCFSRKSSVLTGIFPGGSREQR